MQEYFHLFERTFAAVKEVDGRFRVGGPAVCGGTDEIWIRAFLEFCRDRKIPVDFVTRHHYTTEVPEESGHYGYMKLMRPEDGFANLRTTREIIDSFEDIVDWRFISQSSIPLISRMRRFMTPTGTLPISLISFQGWESSGNPILTGPSEIYLRKREYRLRRFTEGSAWWPTDAFRNLRSGYFSFSSS